MTRRELFFLGLLMAGCEREPDPVVAAKSFFKELSEKRPEAAFRDSAFLFQHKQTYREFLASAHELGLDGCTVVQAGPPTIDGKSAKQVVEIRTARGARMTLVVTLNLERGAWRVFSLKFPMNLETGVSENPFTRIGRGHDIASAQDHPLPEERTAEAMAKETMLQFHDAIQQQSFEEFYDGVARAWQRQLTLGMLTRTFQGFITQRTNLIAIKDLDAVLKNPPRLDSDGLLIVTGSYLTRPHRIDFDIKYYYEMPNWRPFGVAVRLIE